MLWIRRWVVVRKKEHPLAGIGSLAVIVLSLAACASNGVAAGLLVFFVGALVLSGLGII